MNTRQLRNNYDSICKKYADDIIKQYTIDQTPIWDLCKIYNVGNNSLRNFLVNSKIEIRTISDTRKTNSFKNKFKNTCNKKYGVDNPAQLKETKDKVKQTLIKRFGCSNVSKSEYFGLINYFKTGIRNNDIEYKKYRDLVLSETRKNIKNMNFNGKCYYTNVNIFNNNWINDPYHKSVDHKISILGGYKEGASVDKIANIENLCFCSRLCNILKEDMTEQEFIKSKRYQRLIQHENKKIN